MDMHGWYNFSGPEEGRLSGLPVEWVEGDVTRPATLDKVFKGAHVIIHTTAIAIEKGRKTYDEVNAQGTKNVLDAAKRSGVSRFINLSQLGASPDLPYRFLASKGKAQSYVAISGLNWTAFKPSVVWGPEDEFANTFARLVPLTPIIFPLVDKKAKFEPIWVNDIATCIVKSIDDP
jgi:NADH dehydrogenase